MSSCRTLKYAEGRAGNKLLTLPRATSLQISLGRRRVNSGRFMVLFGTAHELIARRANHSISCPARFAKIFLFSSDPNHFTYSSRPVPHEGRLAIVTDAGRDAMDVEVPITNGTEADGEVVWS